MLSSHTHMFGKKKYDAVFPLIYMCRWGRIGADLSRYEHSLITGNSTQGIRQELSNLWLLELAPT
jgi:hypothetical protein